MTKRSLANVTAAGIALFVASTLLMHLVQPDLSARDDAVSYYMNGPFGWIMGGGLVAIGMGSLALYLSLSRTDPLTGRLALSVWACGVSIGGIFPPDPRGSWDKPPSIAGMIHANVAMVALIALPFAAASLSRGLGRASASPALERLLTAFARAAALTLAAFFVSLTPVFFNRPPRLLGVTERVLLGCYAGWLIVAAQAIRQSPPGAARKR